MTYNVTGGGALDYFPCRYGASKLILRGPRRRVQGDFVAFLGGTETYGRFLETPFPAQFEHDSGIKAINLGCINAGPDAYLNDRTLLDICRKARMTVIQVTGAQNLSNRCYSVHPRRNDRFLRASSLLRTVYPDLDFTEFNFTGHLLKALRQGPADSFEMVREELRQAWTTRMTKLIAAVGSPVVLLWLSDHPPRHADQAEQDESEPALVDREMLARLSRAGCRVVQIVASSREIAEGRAGMIHGPLERPAANGALGPVVHRRAAAALARIATEPA